jgi:uncharacterized membrane protein
MGNPRRTAALLIPFPIAFFAAAFVCDLAFWATSSSAWAMGAFWLIGAGVVVGAVAAVAGLTDALRDQRIHALNDAWWQAGGNTLAVLIEIYNWYIRASAGIAAVIPEGLIMSFIAVCLLLFTGWKGWQTMHRAPA